MSEIMSISPPLRIFTVHSSKRLHKKIRIRVDELKIESRLPRDHDRPSWSISKTLFSSWKSTPRIGFHMELNDVTDFNSRRPETRKMLLLEKSKLQKRNEIQELKENTSTIAVLTRKCVRRYSNHRGSFPLIWSFPAQRIDPEDDLCTQSWRKVCPEKKKKKTPAASASAERGRPPSPE